MRCARVLEVLTPLRKTWRQTPDGLKYSYGNRFGWSHMLCALKVCVARGINPREGFF